MKPMFKKHFKPGQEGEKAACGRRVWAGNSTDTPEDVTCGLCLPAANKAKGAQLREEAAESFRREEESFQRSDTDGFLSQWASGIMGRLKLAEAEVAEHGGKASFPHLHTLDGRPVKAKVIKTRFGTAWALLDEQDNFTGQFITYGLTERNLRKKGFQILYVELPAKAKIAASGTGLSGAATAYVTTVQTVDYPDNAVVVR